MSSKSNKSKIFLWRLDIFKIQCYRHTNLTFQELLLQLHHLSLSNKIILFLYYVFLLYSHQHVYQINHAQQQYNHWILSSEKKTIFFCGEQLLWTLKNQVVDYYYTIRHHHPNHNNYILQSRTIRPLLLTSDPLKQHHINVTSRYSPDSIAEKLLIQSIRRL